MSDTSDILALLKDRFQATQREFQETTKRTELLRDEMHRLSNAIRAMQSPPPPYSTEATKEITPSIRALVHEYLRSVETFTFADICEYVKTSMPLAKHGSIRAELSYCKKNGQIVKADAKTYRSLIF